MSPFRTLAGPLRTGILHPIERHKGLAQYGVARALESPGDPFGTTLPT
jgi:hypothetical protein